MGLLSELLLVPLAPVRVAYWSLGQVINSATREYYDPATIRRELADLSRQLDEGLISAEEFDLREDQILDRLEARVTWPRVSEGRVTPAGRDA